MKIEIETDGRTYWYSCGDCDGCGAEWDSADDALADSDEHQCD